MKPEHLAHLRSVSRPSVHPDGTWAVAAVSRPDLDADVYRSALWRFPLGDGAGDGAVRLTGGPADSQPVISPDGRYVAFVRAPEGKPGQLAVLDLAGGDPVVLTDHRLGVASRPVWSPDSRRLAYTAKVPEPGRFGTDPAVGPEAEAPRLITTFTYRRDNVGFTVGRSPQVFVLDLPDPPSPSDGAPAPVVPVRLTGGEAEHAAPVWTPDGTGLLVLRGVADALGQSLVRLAVPAALPSAPQSEPSAPEREPSAPAGEPEAGADPVRDGVEHLVVAEAVATPGAVSALAFGPADTEPGDELWLLSEDLGADGLDFVGTNPALVRSRLIGAALEDVEYLTDPEEHDLTPGTGPGQFEVIDGRALLLRVHRGAHEVVVVEEAGGGWTVRALLGGAVAAGAQAVPGEPGQSLRVVAAAALTDSPGELVLVTDEPGSAPVLLTDLAAALREAAGEPRSSHEVSAAAQDGYPVHGWVVLPDPEVHGPGPYPVLLNVHGGPYAQYSPTFFDEVQVEAGAGYAVVYGNPRGSAGYGQAHGRAIVGGFGTVDADDVTALLDAALAATPELDARRVGVMGGSYGGYMTAWLTTRTDRFAAAIVERGFLDPVSFIGSSDIGWFFGLRYLGEDPDAVAAQSPMAHVGAVTTPTLVIHSEQDWRCPVEQGQRWYTELKRRGVETELLLFPGEGHELTRSGRPRHRLARFEHVLRWWGAHLPVVAATT